MMRISTIGLLLFAVLAPAAEPLRTVAEMTDYKATSRHADVVAFAKALAKQAPLVRLAELGTSHEGRSLPLLILADPPVASAKEAAKGGRLVVLALANIHAGEVDGKEALLMLVRDLALAKDHPLLKDLVLVFAPIFNADGNEKLGTHRPTQAGPERVGTRANAQELDLNRDFVKLESPEVRSLVRFLHAWDPAVVIDCHTTNGSYHRYALTYEGGRCPAGDVRLIDHLRDELLPDASKRLFKATGYRSFFYGNFSSDRSRWETISPTPRFGTHYVGLRNRLGILVESYSYASFRDRVLASKGFVQAILGHVAEHRVRMAKLLAEARQATIAAGRAPTEKDRVVIRHRPALLGRPVHLLGFVEEVQDGRRRSTGKPTTYEVVYTGGTEAVRTVRRPFAYLVPARLKTVLDNLKLHGFAFEPLTSDTNGEVEVYRVDKVVRGRLFQKHQPIELTVTSRIERRRVPKGTLLVRTAQPLGSLLVYLLEPESADGLTTWNFLDAELKTGADYPILRVFAPPRASGHLRPWPRFQPDVTVGGEVHDLRTTR